MIYQALIRRLDQDVTAGTAAFDEILPGTNSFVASLDAPALYAITTSDRVDATLQALLDEYERADRFGFSEAETDVAKQEAQADFDSLYDSRNTTQDVDYATQYVANFLTGDPYPTADDRTRSPRRRSTRSRPRRSTRGSAPGGTTPPRT